MTFNDFHFDLMRVWVISQDCVKLMESVLYTLQVPNYRTRKTSDLIKW